MARWQLLLIAGYAVVFVLIATLVGEPSYLIPYAILGLIVVGYALVHAFIGRNVLARHGGSHEAAASDDQVPIPSTPDVPDATRPAGDTPEAHDEISPRDLPPDHPGRHEAERQAGGQGGTTRGHVEGGAAQPATRSSATPGAPALVCAPATATRSRDAERLVPRGTTAPETKNRQTPP